jgi:hypothetical protein
MFSQPWQFCCSSARVLFAGMFHLLYFWVMEVSSANAEPVCMQTVIGVEVLMGSLHECLRNRRQPRRGIAILMAGLVVLGLHVRVAPLKLLLKRTFIVIPHQFFAVLLRKEEVV